MDHPERGRPALYMVLSRVVASAPMAALYVIELAGAKEWPAARALIEADGVVRDAQWNEFLSRVLPEGGFLVRERATGALVGTASAIHNPEGARFHFAGGGELAYMVVDPSHRGRGLGRVLADRVAARFRSAAYPVVWLGVQGWRLPAIRTYLAAGFRPFLHPPSPNMLEARWRAVYASAGWPFDAADCEQAP